MAPNHPQEPAICTTPSPALQSICGVLPLGLITRSLFSVENGERNGYPDVNTKAVPSWALEEYALAKGGLLALTSPCGKGGILLRVVAIRLMG